MATNEVGKKKMNDALIIKQEKINVARFTKDSRITFQYASLLDEQAARWIMHMKKKIDEGTSAPIDSFLYRFLYELLNFILIKTYFEFALNS